VNEGEIFIVRDRNGKQVFDNHGNKWKLNAQEVRVSPAGDRVAFLKDGVLRCAKLEPKKTDKDGNHIEDE
jgi:hypothetical protein